MDVLVITTPLRNDAVEGTVALAQMLQLEGLCDRQVITGRHVDGNVAADVLECVHMMERVEGFRPIENRHGVRSASIRLRINISAPDLFLKPVLHFGCGDRAAAAPRHRLWSTMSFPPNVTDSVEVSFQQEPDMFQTHMTRRAFLLPHL